MSGINLDERRRSKLEQKQHLQTAESSTHPNLKKAFKFITKIAIKGEEGSRGGVKVDKSVSVIPTTRETTPIEGKTVYTTTYANHVQDIMANHVVEDTIIITVWNIVYQGFNTNCSDIFHRNFHDDGILYIVDYDIVSGEIIKNDGEYISQLVGHVVESNVTDLTADLVESSIVDAGVSADNDVLDMVSESIIGIITDKISDMIGNALFDAIISVYCYNVPDGGFPERDVMANINSESKAAAVAIADDISLAVDDIIASALFDASLEDMSDNREDNTVDHVADKVAEMEI